MRTGVLRYVCFGGREGRCGGSDWRVTCETGGVSFSSSSEGSSSGLGERPRAGTSVAGRVTTAILSSLVQNVIEGKPTHVSSFS